MELKPVITNFGDERLYLHLSPEIERRLPQACIEWERSPGASKAVFLQASFVKFNAANLVSTADSRANISKQPFLHLYWTGCLEFDEYKSGLKDSILAWLKQLKDKGINNWLVVQVYSQVGGKSSKSKLPLQWGTVFDKIKNELCNKEQDRCIQLWEPAKETLFSKSMESWKSLLQLLRQLLLSTIEQHLRRFEDKNRSFRECYSQADWSFTKYFILHEELALILKSVTLHDDALIKYDELDALLSQFIVNSEGRGYPKWLIQFKMPVENWDGISLHKEKVKQARALVYDGKANLLDLRNYLFARQCQLLIKLEKSNDIAKRLHELVYAVKKEIEILEVPLPQGAFCCWVSLSCLYFLQYFENKKPKDKLTLGYLAQTTDYARQKIQGLGELCSLLPSEQVKNVPNDKGVVLLKGLPIIDSERRELPLDLPHRLIDSLSSRKSYALLYIEICERTEKLLTSIGYLRFAMRARIDLLRFYILLGEYDLSEGFLKPPVQVYKEQKWSVLHADVLMLLAKCHLARNELDSYLAALPMLCCANSIDEDKRRAFVSEFLKLSQDKRRIPTTLGCEPVISVLAIKIKLYGEKAHIGDIVNVEITLCNNLMDSIPCDEIGIGLRYTPMSNDKRSQRTSMSNPGSPSNPHPVDQYEVVYDVEKDVPEKGTEFGFNAKVRNTLFRRSHMTRTQVLQKGIDTVDSPRTSSGKGNPALLLDPWEKDIAFNGKSSPTTRLEGKTTLLKLSSSTPILKDIGNEKNDEVLYERTISEKALGEKCNSLNSILLNSHVSNRKPNMEGNEEQSHEQCYEFEKRGNFTSGHKKRFYSHNDNPLSADVTDGDNGTQHDNGLQIKDGQGTVGQSLNDATSVLPTDIETDDDVPPVTSLLCRDVTLVPGRNTLNVSAKILHTGCYTLMGLTCRSGVVKFYHWLDFKRRGREFFVVLDPPEFKCSAKCLADILLTGIKQRLRISIANGPGNISENSVVRLSSSTGLLFDQVPWSSVHLHPGVGKQNTREGAMKIDIVEPPGAVVGNIAHFYLPATQPYDSMNVYIDVTASVAADGSFVAHKAQHKIQMDFLWLSAFIMEPSEMKASFCEPFAVEHKMITSDKRSFIQVSLRGLNPVWLILDKASLSCTNCDALKLKETFKDVEKSLNGEEEFQYLWEITKECSDEVPPDVLQFCFKVTYFIKDNEECNRGIYSKEFTSRNIETLFVVDLDLDIKEPDLYLIKSKSIAARVNVRPSSKRLPNTIYGSKISVLFQNNEFWEFSEKIKTFESDVLCSGLTEFSVDITPLKSGWIPYPLPKFMYGDPDGDEQLLKHSDSIEEGDIWVKRTDSNTAKKEKVNRLSQSRRTTSSVSESCLNEFKEGTFVYTKSGASVWADAVGSSITTSL